MQKIVALITARGGSKGLPGKNIRPLHGKPLIAWTIEAAKASQQVSRIVVSTDDDAIAAVSREFGAEVPFMRPAELAQDTSSCVAVAEHAIGWLERQEHYIADYLVILQPTSPLRTAEDIDMAISLAVTHNARAVISVCEPYQHPFIMKKLSPAGTLVDLLSTGLGYARRQDFPRVYAMNGAIYLVSPSVVIAESTLEPADAIPYIMPPNRSWEIDGAWDFEITEAIMKRQLYFRQIPS